MIFPVVPTPRCLSWCSQSIHIELKYIVTVSIRFSPLGGYKGNQHRSQPLLDPIDELSLDTPVIFIGLG